ncbi:MAG: von Willebrand factor type A domain-containing protein, partial [Mesorhizobium sp.]|nr:von Willebrand factor type A domain-containing protein [Mesorhizobium sp.]
RTMVEPAAPADLYLPQPENRDRLETFKTNPVRSAAEDPVSTFSIDVDTASYSFVRRSLKEGLLPQADTVRVEEMVNYFPYDWKGPETAETPFNSTVTVMPAPWNAQHKLMHVAIKGYDVQPAAQPKANLVFLIDVSGSMNEPDKLPLLQSAFRLLVNKLQPDDTVSIVTYAGNAGTVLEPTKASDKTKILAAIDGLQPGGSTAGEAGIREAYRLAQQSFVKDGINRVMLATDGDFNVGQSDDDDLKRLVEDKRKTGVFLSVLGFGRGNLNDQMMQTIAQNGNGTAAYIDTLAEAEKVLVQDASLTLFPIAKDVKIQVEFNPQKVAEYRLIGYETRALNREDFNNDRV